ncbi:hypothetical protein Y032_0413g1022 [Ancylostoma ceylanicum]|uniref:Uncharacterized protein n=1 Tax=Ancylostoma ceylanicum TaxID=53326 RepID=A0A016X257_9BILA|nr:hypothetical protein Y032_0413g1022 [Ancylostoma ceylanicum]
MPWRSMWREITGASASFGQGCLAEKSQAVSRLAVTTFPSVAAFVHRDRTLDSLRGIRYFLTPAAAAACPAVPFPCHVSAALGLAGIKAAFSISRVHSLRVDSLLAPLRSDDSAPLMVRSSMMQPSDDATVR